MVEEIRNKWCDDLEDLLQCPICMMRPQSWVYQCVQGHHICVDCKTQLPSCPTCTQRWSSARNRLAENLCTKLDDIKLSLIDPESEINKLLIPDRVSVASQTDPLTAVTTDGAAKKTIDEHNGPYPCRIGSCNVNLFYAPLMNHIKADHSNLYVELPARDGAVFQHIWFFDLVELMVFDRVFNVPGTGTFFLKLSTDCFGNLTGFVLMLHNGFHAKQYTYQLEISCCADHNTGKTYTGEICSCRTPVHVLDEKSLRIKRVEIQRMLDHQRNLTCTVLIGNKPQTNTQEISSKPNNQKKKFQNKKNYAGNQPANNPNGPTPDPSRNRPRFRSQQRRPQTAPNAHQAQQENHAQRDHNQVQQGMAGLHLGPGHFGGNHNAPFRASSIPSLFHSNLRDML